MEPSGTYASDGASSQDHSDAEAPVGAPTGRCRAIRVTDHGRRRVHTRRLRTLQVAFLLLGTALAVAGPVGEALMVDPTWPPLVAGVVTACGLVLGVRWWRAAIVVAPGRVTIRGLLLSRNVDSQSVSTTAENGPLGDG